VIINGEDGAPPSESSKIIYILGGRPLLSRVAAAAKGGELEGTGLEVTNNDVVTARVFEVNESRPET
jgi:hypothetical protein